MFIFLINLSIISMIMHYIYSISINTIFKLIFIVISGVAYFQLNFLKEEINRIGIDIILKYQKNLKLFDEDADSFFHTVFKLAITFLISWIFKIFIIYFLYKIIMMLSNIQIKFTFLNIIISLYFMETVSYVLISTWRKI